MKYNIKAMSGPELKEVIESNFKAPEPELIKEADRIRRSIYGDRVFLRGLIEVSNVCRSNCYYCGIRHGNSHVDRYRLTKEEILACCEQGFQLGFRTFVLQGGEDPYLDDKRLVDIISSVREKYPACAITLSFGEKSKESYQRLFEAGANRYLLRHETASDDHYRRLHPDNLSLDHRKKCLYTLKEIGYQVGAGFMVDSPFQTVGNLAEDLLFLKELEPHMVGIGPFIPQKDTPLGKEKAGTLSHTITMLALTRLLLPEALLPSTTALGSIDPHGRERGLQAGANVVMPNLSPIEARSKYSLYDHKVSSGAEAAEGLENLIAQIRMAGYQADFSRGDHIRNRVGG